MPIKNSEQRSIFFSLKQCFSPSPERASGGGSRPLEILSPTALGAVQAPTGVQGVPQHVNHPLPPTPAALQLRPPAPRVDWSRAEVLGRSKEGVHAGVYFVRDGDEVVVVKPSTTIAQEVFVAELAALVGIDTPALRKDAKVPRAAKQKMQADDSRHRVMLSMRFVAGRNFHELTEADRASVLGRHAAGGGAGDGLLPELGRVIAFDYLLQNPDRFPCAGLEGNNPGNLMLDDRGGLQAIDTTLPLLVAEREARAYRRKLGEVLRLAVDPTDALAHAHLAKVVGFFPEHWQVSWDAVAEPVVAGFRAQVRAIAALPGKKLSSLLKSAELTAPHRAAISAQLELFRRYQVA